MMPRSVSASLAALALAACIDPPLADDDPRPVEPEVADHELGLADHEPDTFASGSGATSIAAQCPSQCEEHVMVIGCDDRQFIPNGTDATTTSPWRHVGRLSNGCTGTLIGPKHVLTAAHCVLGYGPVAIGFTLAQTDRAICPMGTRFVKKVYRPAGWDDNSTQGLASKDYAVLELWSGFAGAVPMTYDYVPWADLWARPSYSIGYPGTLPQYDDERPVSTGSKNFGPSRYAWLDGGERGTLQIDNDGEGGQSGSPVYVLLGGVRTVVGVMIGSPIPACEAGWQWAARLTPGAIEHIENAMSPNTLDFYWETATLPYQASKPGC